MEVILRRPSVQSWLDTPDKRKYPQNDGTVCKYSTMPANHINNNIVCAACGQSVAVSCDVIKIIKHKARPPQGCSLDILSVR